MTSSQAWDEGQYVYRTVLEKPYADEQIRAAEWEARSRVRLADRPRLARRSYFLISSPDVVYVEWRLVNEG